MSKLERLKKTKSLSDLAKLLGFTPKGLSYVIHQIPDAKKYRVFEIPKKTGGTRTIKAVARQTGWELRVNQDGDRVSQWVEDCGFGCRAQVVFWALIVAARQSGWVLSVAREGGRPGPR